MSETEVLDALNADPSVVRRIRFANCVFAIQAGDNGWRMALQDGRVARIAGDTPADVTIRITAEAWEAFRQPVPPSGCHDIYAMAESGRATIAGDPLKLFLYSWVLRDILQQLATGRMYG